MLRQTLTIQRTEWTVPNVSQLVQRAKEFKSVIQISHDTAAANAKSTLGLIALSLRPGMTVTVQADGPDETQAVKALSELLT